MKQKLLLFASLLLVSLSLQAQTTGTVTDIEGNVYKTVKIGNYWWMAENLKTKHFQNGDSITIYPEIYFSYVTGEPVTGGSKYDYCIHYTYPNRDASNYTTYGLNYTWSAVFDERGLCPEGWSVPDTTDWMNMAKYITKEKGVGQYNPAGYSEVGKYLKSNSLWNFDGTSLSNDDAYGFGALPSGDFDSNGYRLFGEAAHYWTKEEVCAGLFGRYYIGLSHNSNDIVLGGYRNNNTVCLRCIQAATTALAQTEINNEINVSVDLSAHLVRLFSPEGSAWSLYNLNGVKLNSGKTFENISYINTSLYPAGVYLLSVNKDKTEKRLKIIVK